MRTAGFCTSCVTPASCALRSPRVSPRVSRKTSRLASMSSAVHARSSRERPAGSWLSLSLALSLGSSSTSRLPRSTTTTSETIPHSSRSCPDHTISITSARTMAGSRIGCPQPSYTESGQRMTLLTLFPRKSQASSHRTPSNHAMERTADRRTLHF